MKLYLLRHGESEGNRDNKFRGRADFPLTETGKAQAECAGKYLKGTDFDIILSSPLKRAQETAKIAANHLNMDVVIDERFNNIKLGPWEGREKEFIKREFPKEWDLWTKTPEYMHIDGMESLDELQMRTYKAVCDISSKYSGNVLIVTHRAVLKPMIAKLINIEKPYFWRIYLDTASITVLELLEEERGWMLKNLNINHYLNDFAEERF